MKWTFAFLALIAVSVVAVQAGEWARADVFTVRNPLLPTLGPSFVEFTWNEEDNTTTVHVSITGITNNPNADHGLHIHTYGDLSAVNGTSFGGHWDPEGLDHGCVGDGERAAAGDLGNWTAVEGTIDETRTFTGIPLSGPLSIVGRGVVLHEAPDNCAQVTSAKSRLAGGVIGVKNATGNTAGPNPEFQSGNGPFLAVCVLSATTSGKLIGVNGSFYWTQASTTAGVNAYGTGGRNVTGTFGVHVHAFGDLSSATGLATMGHYDPKATGFHAYPNATGTAHHAGDMGNTDPTNLFDGVMWYSGSFPSGYMTIYGNTSIVGRGFILHNGTDDGTTQPTGNAGARNGQCVIGIANSTLTAVNKIPTRIPSGDSPSAAAAFTISFAVIAAAALLALLF